MPLFTCPIHESNDCHTPAGSSEGGQFCSGKGALPTPGERLEHSVAIAPRSFDLHTIKNSRFMFHTPSATLLLGGSDPDFDSHAVEFDYAKRVLNVPGRFDEYVRGWLGTNRSTYKDGVVHFAPGLRFDAAQRFPEYTDKFMRAIEYFLQHGGSGKTVVRGFDLGDESFEWKVKDKLPSLIPPSAKSSRRRRPA